MRRRERSRKHPATQRGQRPGYLARLTGAAKLVLAVAALILLVSAAVPAFSQGVPARAEVYRRDLVRVARYVFGMDAPVAVLAAQVHQESGWRVDARSAHASGLAQFTPDTAEWISRLYADLGEPAPLSPRWALLALCRYDKRLFDSCDFAATSCDRWAFALSGYNGGPGWIARDRDLASRSGADPRRWWGHAELFSSRSAPAFRENRDYPRRILFRHQAVYAAWGPTVPCGEGSR